MANGSNPRATRGNVFALLLALSLAGLSSGAAAQPVVAASGDVTLALGPGNTVVRDEQVAVDNQLGVIALESIGAIPAQADVIGYGQGLGALRYLSFDTTVALAGGVVARPGDVVEWNGAAHSIVFDAASISGFPVGVRIDAIAPSSGGRLLLSFDTDVSLPGSLIAADEDLVAWDGASFSLAFDGSAAGLDRRLDVDGAQDLGGGALLLSFDTGGSAPGPSSTPLPFQDEDIVRHVAGVFTLELDGSSLDADWGAADLDAFEVPEPSGPVSLVAGLALLGAAARRRRARRIVVGSWIGVAAAGALLPTAVYAGDGRAEINQTCAITTGCFAGDPAGFPVTIDGGAGVAYRLTSDLVVDDPNTSAILLARRAIDIDLAGHAIRGPGDCPERPAPCPPVAGSGAGIDAAIDAGVPAATTARYGLHSIHDGLISGMASDGIRVGSAFVRAMRIESNAGHGIDLNNTAGVVEASTIARNGGAGVKAIAAPPFAPTLLEARANTVLNNGLQGFDIEKGLLLGNTITGNLGIGVRASLDALMVDNVVGRNAGDGIELGSAARGLILGNAVAENAIDGIDLGSGTGVAHLIQRNSIEQNAGMGLRIPNRGAYRENTIRSAPGGSTVSNPLAIDLGANACNGAATCP